MSKITINDEKKIEILLNAIEERYNSIHIIRERVHNICLWMMGILVGGAGWLLQSEHIIFFREKVIYTFILGISYILIRFFYLSDLEKGFKTQLQTVAKIEKTLGLYEKGLYDETENSIYPKSWEYSGQSNSDGKYFHTNYLLLNAGFLILLISIWIQSCIGNYFLIY